MIPLKIMLCVQCIHAVHLQYKKNKQNRLIGESNSKVLQKTLIIDEKLWGEINFGKCKVRLWKITFMNGGL